MDVRRIPHAVIVALLALACGSRAEDVGGRPDLEALLKRYSETKWRLDYAEARGLFRKGTDVGDRLWASWLEVEGGSLKAQAAEELEAMVEQNPDDMEARTLLIGCYSRYRRNADAKKGKARFRHVLWVIRNRPTSCLADPIHMEIRHWEDPKAYAEASGSWRKAAEDSPDDVKVIGNAARFFMRDGTPGHLGEAIRLLERAALLSPDDPEWPSLLGRCCSRILHWLAGKQRIEMARRALSWYESALELSGRLGRQRLLVDLAETAFAAGDMAKSKAYALEAIVDCHRLRDGRAIHYASTVLGQIALREGDTEEAKQRLVAAGKTPGSLTLRTFGPTMKLAKELLDVGEREVVVQYLKLCSNFWEGEDGRLKRWQSDITEGRMPDFRCNLYR